MRKQNIELYTLCTGSREIIYYDTRLELTLYEKKSMEIQRFDLNYTF